MHCQEQQQSCGGRLDGESGTLRYPHTTGQSYDHNVNCAWVITTSPNKIMSLWVVRFNLEAHDNCGYDFLQINDGPDASSNVIGKYCGDAFPNGGTINSTHNQLYLWFRSDASVASDGFVISWSSGLPGWLTFSLFAYNE
jgi:cubilin